jgi:capsular polysaccharide export protein
MTKVISSAVSTVLNKKTNWRDPPSSGEADPDLCAPRSAAHSSVACEPFFRIPPFPGARCRHFEEMDSLAPDRAEAIKAARRLRVGGTYWGAQPDVPDGCVILRCPVEIALAQELASGRPIVAWNSTGSPLEWAESSFVIRGDCDPWHVLARASSVVGHAHDELRLIAALLDVPYFVFDQTSGEASLADADALSLLGNRLGGAAFANPFTGEPMSLLETIELCGFWRRLIDSNRHLGGAMGFAFWKQNHVAPLLWGGCAPVRFLTSAAELTAHTPVAVWRSKVAPGVLAELARVKVPLVEVEDGFLRSRGLGADCVPPLSITVDSLGAHFDPSRPSELEELLQKTEFDSELLARARQLRRLIVEAGIGKYGRGIAELQRPGGRRRHILVPGQVEDDRAVRAGGCGLESNLDLLAMVRERAPDAYILYKPHPDVLAGHRRGAIADGSCLLYADEIVGELPIASLIAMVDEVHVNTSLAGFEALLHGKGVTTYGVPFYAGLGLTEDLGPVPARRTAKRTIDELVAATLLLYPRYLDPVTGLPCPAEIVVARLSVCDDEDPGLVVGVRRIQGKVMRRLRRWVQ